MSDHHRIFAPAFVFALALGCSGNGSDTPGGSGGGGNPMGGSSSMGGSPSTTSGGAPSSTGGSSTTSGGSAQTSGGSAATTGGAATGGSKSGGKGGTAGSGGSKSSSGGSSSGGAATTGGSGGSGGSVTPPSCTTPLSGRVTITSIPVTSKVVTKGVGINSVNMPIILATSPNGKAKIAWTDGSNVHITPLDAANQRAADDATIMGSEVRGFVAHDDGSAVMVRRGDAMVFVRLSEAGAATTTLSLVGGNTHMTKGDRWIDDWPHQGRLAWSGTQYAAYFGQTGNHGADGNHQGDHYSLITAAGALDKGGWDWGCSHSLDERIAHNGTAWAPICTVDSYPGKGIYFNNRTQVSSEPSVTNVGGVAKLGGLVPAADGFYLTFTSPEMKSSTEVVFTKISNTGMPSGRAYITDTPSTAEGYSHLTKFGDQLLAGWDTGNNTAINLAVIDTTGKVVEPATVTTARAGGQDDFATFANGDAGWAGAWDDLNQLKVVRVARCQP